MIDLVALSIPVFFLLIGLELIIQKMSHTELYRFNDALSNISCGIVQQIVGVLAKTLLIGLYIYLYEYHRLLTIPDQWWSYVFLLFGVDFFYYWFHRYAHEISFIWGTHVVHHQSEEYNLSVALRQSAFQGFVSVFFYLPLALLGFSPLAFIFISSIQLLYQFWIHTKAINKMPAWFEYIFNTPSHHRVHHGVNPEYIDKNHGGTFIIFDRMFGTFQAEAAPVVYGVSKPLASWNPVWANFDYYRDLAKEWKLMPTLGDKIRLLLDKPGWRPATLGGSYQVQPITPEQQHKYNPAYPQALNYYLLAQYILLLVGASGFLFAAPHLSNFQKILLAIPPVWTTMNVGVLMENKSWAARSEYMRLLSISVFLYIAIPPTDNNTYYLLLFWSAAMLLSLFWFYAVQHRKYRPS